MTNIRETIGLLLRQAKFERDKLNTQISELTDREKAYDSLVATLEAAQQDAAEIGE